MKKKTPLTDEWIADVVATLRPLCTIDEAAELLRTSTRNLRRLIAAGRIETVRSRQGGGSRVLIPRVELGRFLRGLASER